MNTITETFGVRSPSENPRFRTEEERLTFLRTILDFYLRNPQKRSLDVEGDCVYVSHTMSFETRCAIGWCLTDDQIERIYEIEQEEDIELIGVSLAELIGYLNDLPWENREDFPRSDELSFATFAQTLHDRKEYWPLPDEDSTPLDRARAMQNHLMKMWEGKEAPRVKTNQKEYFKMAMKVIDELIEQYSKS